MSRTKQPTVREALVEAHQAVIVATAELRDAQRRRTEVFIAANDQGVSLREIASVVGVTAQAIHQWIGRRDTVNSQDRLDQPLRT